MAPAFSTTLLSFKVMVRFFAAMSLLLLWHRTGGFGIPLRILGAAFRYLFFHARYSVTTKRTNAELSEKPGIHPRHDWQILWAVLPQGNTQYRGVFGYLDRVDGSVR